MVELMAVLKNFMCKGHCQGGGGGGGGGGTRVRVRFVEHITLYMTYPLPFLPISCLLMVSCTR